MCMPIASVQQGGCLKNDQLLWGFCGPAAVGIELIRHLFPAAPIGARKPPAVSYDPVAALLNKLESGRSYLVSPDK